MKWPRWMCRAVPYLERRQAEIDLEDELALHLELERERLRELGRDDDEARRRAVRTLGNRIRIVEDTRAVWSWQWLDRLVQDLRHVTRGLARRPGFAVIVTAILALGIGTTTATFSLVHGVVLSPLPYADPERLIALHLHARELRDQFPALPANLRSIVAWERCASCEGIAALGAGRATLTGSHEPRALDIARVTTNFFDLLGTEPLVGRTFVEADGFVDRDDVAILTYRLWRDAFGGRPDVVGRLITLDDRSVEVIGVLPPSFWLPRVERLSPMPFVFGETELFEPLSYTAENAREAGGFTFAAVGRLRPGVSTTQAHHELESLTSEAFADHPTLTVTSSVRPLADQILDGVDRSIWLLMGAVLVVFVVACVNVMGLCAARRLERSRELAVRSAIGGGPRDLVRHTLSESTCLAAGGGLIGLVVAEAFLRVVVTAAPVDVPRLSQVELNLPVMGIAALLTTICAIGCGLLPAWRATTVDPGDTLKAGLRSTGGDRSTGQASDLFVLAQVALTVVLLTTCGLLLSSFLRVLEVDRGFDVDRVVAVDLTLPGRRYDSQEQRARFYDELGRRLETAPGIDSVGLSQKLPLEGESFVEGLVPEGDARPELLVGNFRFVNPDYFATLGMTLTRGRHFTETDRNASVAIVTEQTARRLWPAQDPVGRRFARGDRGGPTQEVIGVVADARILGLEHDPGLVIYQPYWETAMSTVSVVVRGTTAPRDMFQSIRAAVTDVDPQLAVRNQRTLDDVLARGLSTRTFLLQVTSGFGLSSLMLVCLGIFGTVSGSVVRRRREFALRSALGATAGAILRHIVGGGLRPVLAGLLVGLAGAVATSRLVEGLLFNGGPSRPLVFGSAVVVVLGLSGLACLPPSLRAIRTSPGRALQSD